MKIGRLHIIWEGREKTVVVYPGRLSRLDLAKITQYLLGGFHIHKNPRKKPLFNLPPPKEEEKEDESHATLPRHTPEKLDRLIEVVREANSSPPKIVEKE